MRHALLIVALALAACGPSPTQRCLDTARAKCTRIFECVPESARQSAGFDVYFGHDVEGCVNRQASYASCWSKEKDDDLCTGGSAGKKFDSSAAETCLEKLPTLPCPDVASGATAPECAKICK